MQILERRLQHAKQEIGMLISLVRSEEGRSREIVCEALADYLSDKNRGVRRLAYRTLDSISKISAQVSFSERVGFDIAVLDVLARSRDEKARVKAFARLSSMAKKLSSYTMVDLVIDKLEELAVDANPQVRRLALHFLNDFLYKDTWKNSLIYATSVSDGKSDPVELLRERAFIAISGIALNEDRSIRANAQGILIYLDGLSHYYKDKLYDMAGDALERVIEGGKMIGDTERNEMWYMGTASELKLLKAFALEEKYGKSRTRRTFEGLTRVFVEALPVVVAGASLVVGAFALLESLDTQSLFMPRIISESVAHETLLGAVSAIPLSALIVAKKWHVKLYDRIVNGRRLNEELRELSRDAKVGR